MPAMTQTDVSPVAAPARNELNAEQIAHACKALGDPLRLAIVQLLGRGSFGVLELCELLDIKQSSMSHHLKILAQARLVSNQREGNSIFYRRPLLASHDRWTQWLATTLATLDALNDPQDNGVEQRLQQVLANRAAACAEFFARNAAAFKQQQDLIASYDQYGEPLERLITTMDTPTRRALEIGPGEGAFLPALARRFDQVLALDISAPMLQKAQQRIDQQPLDNVSCQLGDSSAITESHRHQFDLVVANMVLHHVPAPKTIFADVARLLTDDGCFLVTDLCRHQQAWARESCGDLWLGFEPDDLTAWAVESGLNEGQSQYLGLRNGFQIQFRLFYRA
ncbi:MULTISPECIES: metalloregulator ArsR/SmtB family transcription factor [unclassified Oceanobacter]|uniref:ArsR/SmtB family transcription factor n=2 Tax=Gammaproteobacteria TaxID=1236 RepID=UPI0026E14EE2|nr:MULTISPECIES: metalloregulator ArsR/SmtB family transcription factor [unclassified Oceanobacter]MDO6683353.1 metalloregulator ArsR/SmtB family transcription factor [Oceanobacter sp. 5_MG-2023]MDP2507119.1 metalloregulator ArsR/SmtB family transcription factor [Oceanobacter sp. 3_MG-2023]MDP2609910.1 metalloregulator ArsR/SmtB family transcription factor [Oceanobacter sp. 1_MG-2023]MDP2613208.1 metalloregulator ArsR/SmtB family transcription factor [Oceanobacter sp. 2_MG-2023]